MFVEVRKVKQVAVAQMQKAWEQSTLFFETVTLVTWELGNLR